jgi:type IV fimbrial biogenesis protein FimT
MRSSRGFTLIELLTVITILGVMMGIGIPSFRNFIATQRVKSASYELSTSLLFARSEAVKRNAQVKLAPATGTDWATGWNMTINSSGTVLQTQSTLEGLTVTESPAGNIIFEGTGRPTTGTAKTKWQIGSTITTSIRCVILDTAGVASTSSGVCP